MEIKDLADLVQKQNETFYEFKSANNQRLDEIAKNGAALPETIAKVEAIDNQMSSLDELRERLEKMEADKDMPQFSKGDMSGAESAQLEAFRKMIRTAREGERDFDPQAVAEYKERSMAVSIGTPTAGGHGVPEAINRQIDQKLLDISPLLQYVRVVDVGTSDYKELVDVRGDDSGWVGEVPASPAGTRSETATPGLEQVAPTFGMVYAYPKATEESLQDIFFDVESWLVNSAVERFAKRIGEAIISGNGTNKPTGFLNGTPVPEDDDGASPIRPFGTLQYVPTGFAGAFPSAINLSSSPQITDVQADFLITTVHKLKAGYRANARWMMNKSTMAAVRKFRDADGQYIWRPGMEMGVPSSLLGFPVVEAEDMPDIGSNTFPIAFGDFNAAYTFCNRVGTSITVDDNITTPGYVKFYIRRRVGGILRNDDALKVVKCAAS
jgi:HK97 family phage major capsid protein